MRSKKRRMKMKILFLPVVLGLQRIGLDLFHNYTIRIFGFNFYASVFMPRYQNVGQTML
jgi:hypothetical protein